jgi:alpha-amylase/alpha-mannosidase (GH57 family)
MINICIHGHFYQPPRENPWTGEIEEQPGAKPYHDWNERIYSECYKPNTEAEIINETGEVVTIVNNYEYINFNFGPALLAWIKRKHPDIYNKIIAADRKSAAANNSHGNAMAMCYNHMIMPLADFNDKVTQVIWGLEDFKYHFGRDSEGIWLPETACNMETIEVLISLNVKYIILDTSQAAFVRKHDEEEWTDVNPGNIDSGQPYKCYSEINKDKFINIFFYNGPVSKAVAFDDVLASSQNLLDKIIKASEFNSAGENLVSVATDGETFGHHKKFSERTLAFFIKTLVPANKINIFNFGSYLEKQPARFEVKLKPGDNGEGTSWSCPHGVKRWKEDCGCGGGDGWNQKWRKPLREAMDWLRDNLVLIYEQQGSLYFKNAWNARNKYIKVILGELDYYDFMKIHSSGELTEPEINSAISLLEMQKFSMLMYTSCGWFFSEISGIETVKILEYAARAIEIAESITKLPIEEQFIKKLYAAKSNLKKFENGKNIYLKLVKNVNG